ncbi:MAG: hypothetical protein COA58_05660 [Bacteroidetes bacterium]|nr:MAG: hypothetical protein COA58_05660 [Bacteroidota bacterium]
MGRIGKTIYYSVVVLLVLVFLIVLFNNSFVGSGFGIGIGLFLAVTAIIATLVSSVMYIIDNPKSAINMLVGLGIILVVALISYLIAPGALNQHHIDYGVDTVGQSKMVDMGIYITIFLGVAAVASILVSESVALFKN